MSKRTQRYTSDTSTPYRDTTDTTTRIGHIHEKLGEFRGNTVKSDITPCRRIYNIFCPIAIDRICESPIIKGSEAIGPALSKDANMANFLSAKDVAIQLDVDAKTFRRFVRAYVKRLGGTIGADTPGRGGRYAFDESEMDAIRDAFIAWRTTRSGMHVSFVSADESGDDE